MAWDCFDKKTTVCNMGDLEIFKEDIKMGCYAEEDAYPIEEIEKVLARGDIWISGPGDDGWTDVFLPFSEAIESETDAEAKLRSWIE